MTTQMGMTATDGAPIVQLLLTASFTPAASGLSILDLADLYGSLKQDFPVFRQVIRAGPMTAEPSYDEPDFTHLAGLPRVSFSTDDLSKQLLFQNDRLSLGWVRTSGLNSASGYPGFDLVFREFFERLQFVQSWITSRGESPSPAVGEIVYADAFPMKSEETGVERKVSDIFNFVNPAATPFLVRKFEYSWLEPLPEGQAGYVTGNASGPTLSPAGSLVLMLETTAQFALTDRWADIPEQFAATHRAIGNIFERMVNPAVRTKS